MPEKRPSDARRAELRKSVAFQPTVSSFFPITRYYEAADELFASIQATSQNPKELDLCYVYCKRYCGFVFDAIPTHSYYKAPIFNDQRVKHKAQLQLTLDILEKVAAQMDEEELLKEEQQEIKRQAPRQLGGIGEQGEEEGDNRFDEQFLPQQNDAAANTPIGTESRGQ